MDERWLMSAIAIAVLIVGLVTGIVLGISQTKHNAVLQESQNALITATCIVSDSEDGDVSPALKKLQRQGRLITIVCGETASLRSEAK